MSAQRQVTVFIDGMHCGSCVGRVEAALRAVDGVENVSVNLAAESAQIGMEGGTDLTSVAAALDRVGYPLRQQTTRLTISEMSCASCVGRVQRALGAVPGVLEADVNLASESATLRYAEGVTRPGDLIAAARDAGYPAEIADDGTRKSSADRKADEARQLWRNTVIAAALALPVFLIEMGGHVIPGLQGLIHDTIGQQASWLVQFALTTLVLAGPGRMFYVKGVPALPWSMSWRSTRPAR